MMHIDNKHRILPICLFPTYESFLFAKQNFGTNPMYMIIGHELHGYNVLEENKPCKLADYIEFYSYISYVPDSFKDGDICYIYGENQIYQKWDGKLTKGYVFTAKDLDSEYSTVVFSDYLEVGKLEVFDTCEEVCETFFQFYDFETGKGRLKPITKKRFFYCKENHSIYAIVDDFNLNCICTNVGYGFKARPEDGVVLSKSRKSLFKNGKRCNTFSFVYDEMIWNIKIG